MSVSCTTSDASTRGASRRSRRSSTMRRRRSRYPLRSCCRAPSRRPGRHARSVPHWRRETPWVCLPYYHLRRDCASGFRARVIFSAASLLLLMVHHTYGSGPGARSDPLRGAPEALSTSCRVVFSQRRWAESIARGREQQHGECEPVRGKSGVTVSEHPYRPPRAEKHSPTPGFPDTGFSAQRVRLVANSFPDGT